jgi:hypothetical protein
MMRNVRSFSLTALAAFVTACSGGGASPGGSPPVVKQPVPTSAPASGKRAAATLRLVIPKGSKTAKALRRAASAKRQPKYISPGSAGAILTATSSANSADDETYGYDLSASNCAFEGDDETIVCTLSFPLYADTYSINVKVYDQNEDGVTGGAGSPASPAGNELSVDTENETVVIGAENAFTNFLLHAIVASFVTTGAQYTGAVGGTALSNPQPSQYFVALDADGYNVDNFGNATTYANAPLAVTETDLGDTTACESACTIATNSHGTSPSSSPAAIDALADLTLTLAYTGGGGPGAGVKASTGGAAPAPGSQGPYEGKVTAVAPAGGAASASTYVVPLFAYPASLGITDNAVHYLWAAQAAPPTGASSSSYTATTTTCAGIATIGTGSYHAGYGEVYPITPVADGSCTITLSDSATPADTVSVPVTVGTPGSSITIPCPQATFAPTGASVLRRHLDQVGDAPTLVQFAVGAQQVTLPNPVTAGDTLVLIIGDNPGGPNLPAQYIEFDAATDEFGWVYTSDVAASGSIGTLSSGDNCNTAMWLGEFSGTSSASIQAANAGAGQTADATTPSIVPNAANGLVITSFVSDDTTPATASSGYTEYFSYGAGADPDGPPNSSLDVQLATAATTDTTDPVSNTFAGVAQPQGHAEIFQIPPSSFSGSNSRVRKNIVDKAAWLRIHRPDLMKRSR